QAHSLSAIQSGVVAPRKIRLVYVIDRLGSNLAGTENQLLKIIDGLNPERFQLHLICFDEHPWFQENRSRLKCQTHLIRINRFKHPATYWHFFKLVRLLRSLRPDVVHTFFPVGNIVGVLGARLAGVKHIVSSRRDYGEWMRRDYLLMTR